MQHPRHQSSSSRKSRRSRNRSVSGDLTLGNSPNGSLDAHPHLRGLIRGRFLRTSLPCPLQVLASLHHNAIHPALMSQSDPTDTTNHKIIPCSNARYPTCLMVATEMPLPIRNKVAVNPIFATFTATP